jgi:hypothetical protein
MLPLLTTRTDQLQLKVNHQRLIWTKKWIQDRLLSLEVKVRFNLIDCMQNLPIKQDKMPFRLKDKLCLWITTWLKSTYKDPKLNVLQWAEKNCNQGMRKTGFCLKGWNSLRRKNLLQIMRNAPSIGRMIISRHSLRLDKSKMLSMRSVSRMETDIRKNQSKSTVKLQEHTMWLRLPRKVI